MISEFAFAQQNNGSFDWVRVLTDSIENKTDLCTTCTTVPPEMRSYIAPSGELRFRLHYSCGLFDGASLYYNTAGEFIGGCVKDSINNECDEFNLSVSYTFGRDITTIWACDVGYNCIDVSRFDLFQPFEVIVSGDPCLDSVRTLLVSEDFRSYEWRFPSGEIATENNITVDRSGEYQLILTAHDGCQDTSTVIVDISQQVLNSISGSTIICDESGTQLQMTGFDNYRWSNGSTGSEIIVYDAGIFSVDACNANGCCETFSVEVFDHSKKDIRIADIDETIYKGQEVSLNADLTDINSAEIEIIRWWSNELLLSEDELMFSFQIQDESYVEVELITINGCRYTSDTWVTPEEVNRNFYLPNTFRPNSTLGNDVLFFQSIPGTIQIHAMTIYDRWGTPVYINTAPQGNNRSEGWDGTKNGQLVPSGNYTYSIDLEYANGEREFVVGSILLIN